VEGHRWKNRPHLGEWESAIEAGQLPATEVESLTDLHRAGELAMLLLRLAPGIEYAEFQRRSGFDARELFADPIDRFSRQGLLRADAEGVRLTEVGVNVADALAAEFLAAAV
jgi:coproporphyrinogen III oxidase-like Fe-S oxidoreductase